MASSPPPSSLHAEGGASAGSVCCMCGDQGLPGELVRCKHCRVRLQHRYCSDLYPRSTAYRRCNWCLRVSDQGRRAGHAAAAAVANNNKSEERRKAASGSSAASDEERRQRQRHEGCSSRRPPAEPGHPVKKKHKTDQEMMPPPPPVEGKGIVTDASGSKEVTRAGKTRVNRVKIKVRRYKLLAEVISC